MGNRVICVFYVSYRSIIDFEIVIQYNKRKHTIANCHAVPFWIVGIWEQGWNAGGMLDGGMLERL